METSIAATKTTGCGGKRPPTADTHRSRRRLASFASRFAFWRGRDTVRLVPRLTRSKAGPQAWASRAPELRAGWSKASAFAIKMIRREDVHNRTGSAGALSITRRQSLPNCVQHLGWMHDGSKSGIALELSAPTVIDAPHDEQREPRFLTLGQLELLQSPQQRFLDVA